MNEFSCQVPDGYYCEIKRNFLNGPDFGGIGVIVLMVVVLLIIIVVLTRN